MEDEEKTKLMFTRGYSIGIKSETAPTSPNNYELAGFADDAALLAGIVHGIAVAQQIKDGSLKEDELFGELLLGLNQSMDSFASANVSGLATDLLEIGQIAVECGSGGRCGAANDEIIADGIEVFRDLDGAMKEDLVALLKDENAFAPLTDLRNLLKSHSATETDVVTVYDSLRVANVTSHDVMAFFFSSNAERLKRIVAAESEFERLKTSIVSLKPNDRAEFGGKIDNLLQLESIQENFPAQNEKVKRMNEELVQSAMNSKKLTDAFSKERVDRIEKMLDEMIPIVAWTSKHPLLLLVTDFDKTIRSFEIRFLGGANADGEHAVQLKTILDPIRTLNTNWKSLQEVWISNPDGTLVSIDKVRSNLALALSDVDYFSSLSSVYRCTGEVTLESFDFDELRMVRKKLNAVEEDAVNALSSLQNPYKALTKFMQFAKIGLEKGDIKSQMAKITNTAEVLEELKLFKRNPVSLNGKLKEWFEVETMDKIIYKLNMKNVTMALGCLKTENLLSYNHHPVELASLQQLTPNNPDVGNLVSLSVNSAELMKKWEKRFTTKMARVKTRRATREEIRRWEGASDAARKLLNVAKATMDMATGYKNRETIREIIKWLETLEDQINALKDPQQRNRAKKVLNDNAVNLRRFADDIENLNGYFLMSPKTLRELKMLFDALVDFVLPSIDSYQLGRTLRFVKDPDMRARLQLFTMADLSFANANAHFHDAQTVFATLEPFLADFMVVGQNRDNITFYVEATAGKSVWRPEFYIPIICLAAASSAGGAGYAGFQYWKSRGYKELPQHETAEEPERKQGEQKLVPNVVLMWDEEEARAKKEQVELKCVGDGVMLDSKSVPAEAVELLGGETEKTPDCPTVQQIGEIQNRKHNPEQYGRKGMKHLSFKLRKEYPTEYFLEPMNREREKYTRSNEEPTFTTLQYLYTNVGNAYEDVAADEVVDDTLVQTVDETVHQTATTPTSKIAHVFTGSKQKTTTEKTQDTQESTRLLSKTASETRTAAGVESTDSEADVEFPSAYLRISDVERDGGIVQRHGEPINPDADYMEVKRYKDCCVRTTHTWANYQRTVSTPEYQENFERIARLGRQFENESAEERAAAGADALNDWKKNLRKDHEPSNELRRKYFPEEFMLNGKINYLKLVPSLFNQTFVEAKGFYHPLYRPDCEINPFRLPEVSTIFSDAAAVFDKDPPVLQLDGLFIKFGDIHADYGNLIRLISGRDKILLKKRIIFIGDLVDRGWRSVCCAILICVLKILYPDMVYWVRGNHEFMQTNSRYGLLDECLAGFGENGRKVHYEMNMMMEKLPMCCIQNDIFLLCHGGWSPLLTSRKAFFELVKKVQNKDPREYTDTDLIALALCWSDPIMYYPKGLLDEIVFMASTRGAPGSYFFNIAANADMAKKCGFKAVIRAHQVRPQGFYEYPKYDGVSLWTIYSAPNSTSLGKAKSNNWAAFIEDFPGNRSEVKHVCDEVTYSPDSKFANEDTAWDDSQYEKTNEQIAARKRRESESAEVKNEAKKEEGKEAKRTGEKGAEKVEEKKEAKKIGEKEAKKSEEKKEAKKIGEKEAKKVEEKKETKKIGEKEAKKVEEKKVAKKIDEKGAKKVEEKKEAKKIGEKGAKVQKCTSKNDEKRETKKPQAGEKGKADAK